MLHTAAKSQTVSMKHLIDLVIQAGIAVIIDGQLKNLSALLLMDRAGFYEVVNTTVDSITVKTIS